MAKKPKPRKTAYCIHAHNCDRPENCLDGESCTFMEVEGDYKHANNNCEHLLDDIWEGKRE